MRLEKKEIEGIVSAIAPFLPACSAELRLFGSRVDDHKRGGDIDLVLLIESDSEQAKLDQDKHRLLAAMKLC
jgi:hypothetical protein